MAPGDGYGSEYNLHRYVREHQRTLDHAITNALAVPAAAEIRWIYPTPDANDRSEPRSIHFIDDAEVREAWSKFWPKRGPSWDAVGKLPDELGGDWILVEAKSNHPEFCSQRCKAGDASLGQIQRSLAKVKKHLGVHSAFSWVDTYYQYANRLATLYFLTERVRQPARLVFLYFVGDDMGDGRPCPATEAEWRELIQACHRTLGLREDHELHDRVFDVFLRALPKH